MALTPYIPPTSPYVVFNWAAMVYTPPTSPYVLFNFGVDNGGAFDGGILKANYTIFLMM